MEIKLVTGETSYIAGINTLKKIDVKNCSVDNIVVVPDSFSLQAENLIFDVLGIKSTFNIEVVGISRLASKILRNNNIKYERISGLEEVFNIFHAVKECENEFHYFHKCSVDFSIKILQIIKQFKACNITPDKIKMVGDDLLDRKMQDLKNIYQHYEKLLGEKMDLPKLLSFFLEQTSIVDLHNTNLYFINFDSFTSQINSFICQLAKNVNKVYIGMAKPISQGNEFIYENDIFLKTMKFAKENGVLVEVENFAPTLKNERLAIVKNLFSFDIKPYESEYFFNIMAKNIDDEVEYIAKYIRNCVYKNASYKNFAIAVPNDTYYDIIKTKFSKYDIAYYCDDAISLNDTVLGRFIFKMLQISKVGFNKENLKYIVSNSLLRNDKEKEILSIIDFRCIDDKVEFLSFYPEYQNIIDKITSLKHCKKIMDFINVIKDIIETVENNYSKLLEQMEDDFYYKKQSENFQAKELVLAVFDKLADLSGDQEIDFVDFESLLKMSFKSVKVETVPSYIDAVFVGDATSSYFEDIDNLIVLGATSLNLPKSQSDTGIIDDDDIKKLRFEFALEPEIKVLNRRNRLKLFEVLQHGIKTLLVSMPLTDGKMQFQRAGFLNDLIAIFGNNIIHTASSEDFNLGLLNEDEVLDKLLFCLGNNKNLLDSYSHLLMENKLNLEQQASLKSIIKENLELKDKYALVNRNIKTPERLSASALENYFYCPFKYFLNYVLKIKPNETILPDKRVFGSFEHALLQKFVEENKDSLSKFSKDDVDKFINAEAMNLARQFYDEKYLKEKHFINFLMNESRIILNNVVYEQSVSEFRPLYLEKKILKKIGKLNLVGYIDRVDVNKDYFRIIDYKTGHTNSLKTELYYGKKLQLFLYANAMKEELGLECAGVYYFDCKTKYLKNNKSVKLFNGLTLKDDEVLFMIDRTLDDGFEKSRINGAVRKKNPKKGESVVSCRSAIDDLGKLIDYSVDISKNAYDEITDGFIERKPGKGDCEFCPYLSVCKLRDVDGYRLRSAVKEAKK